MLAPTSKQAHRIGLIVQFPYIHYLSRWWHIYESMWKYAEIAWRCYMHALYWSLEYYTCINGAYL